MRIAKGILFFAALGLTHYFPVFANPCAGKGTQIFFVNGVYNTEDQARDALINLKDSSASSLHEIQNLHYNLA